jgi:hypothetical protein
LYPYAGSIPGRKAVVAERFFGEENGSLRAGVNRGSENLLQLTFNFRESAR